MTAAATKTKPEHRLQPVSGVIPTPEQELKMDETLPEASTTVEQTRPPLIVHLIRESALADGGGACWTSCGDVLLTPTRSTPTSGHGREKVMCPACEAVRILRGAR